MGLLINTIQIKLYLHALFLHQYKMYIGFMPQEQAHPSLKLIPLMQ